MSDGLTFGSVCSGIEAASVAWNPIGIHAAWLAEVDKFPSAVLAHHYPDIVNLGDMTQIAERVLSGEVDAPDILVGGTPCFTAGQSVLTDRGYVPIENIAVGDQVVTHEGRLRRVVRIGSKNADVGVLKGVGLGAGIACTAKHPFRSVEWSNQNTRRGGRYAKVEHVGNPAWTEAAGMPGKQWCALLSVNIAPPAFPAGITTEELLYIAGFYLGDGFIRRWNGKSKKAVIFGVNDGKLAAFKERVSRSVTVLSERTGPRIQLSCTAIADWLVANFGEHSHGKTVPAWVLAHPDRVSVLEGYRATDGHTTSNGWRAISVSRALAYGMRDLAQTLGMVASVSFTETAATTVIEGRTVNQRDYWTVTAFNGESRKSRTRHGMLLRTVSSFQPVGVETVFNIEVEGDNSYILDGAIVHNCQAFSVAGMRGGLSDERGALTIKYVELADAIDDIRSNRGDPESIIVWENVLGVLNSKDNAFGCFLGALAGEDCELQPAGKRWPNAGCVYGPKRAIAWRVLDAQYFGLAQRRKRVFLVASARDGFDPAKVLFEFDSVRRDSAPRREKGESTANTIAPSLTASGRGVGRVGDTRGQDPVVAVPYRMVAFGEYADDESASTMKARDYKDATDLVCVNGSHHGSRVDAIRGTQDPIVSTERAHALDRNSGQENAVFAFAQNSRDEVRLLGGDGSVSGALSASPGMKQTTYIAHSYGIPGNWIGSKPGQQALSAIQEMGRPAHDQDQSAHQRIYVRRLTPKEAERLQGFQDNYTQIPWRDKPATECPDGHRYKALGNSMAVPCMSWLGRRIEEVLCSSAKAAN